MDITIKKDITFNRSQIEAIEFFEEKGYLVIDAARQTGKTLVLREIIKRNKGKKIGVIMRKEDFFNMEYKDLEAEYIGEETPVKEIISRKFDIIIGDGVFIKPNKYGSVKTACAFTPSFTICDLIVDEGLALKQQRILDEETFKREFGRYITL